MYGMQTSRPSVRHTSDESSEGTPYAPGFSAGIAQSLCRKYNIRHCIFVGQADGSAIAVLAAASSRRSGSSCHFHSLPASSEILYKSKCAAADSVGPPALQPGSR